MNLDKEATLTVQRKTLEALKAKMATLEMKVVSLENKLQEIPASTYTPQAPYVTGGLSRLKPNIDVFAGPFPPFPKREMTESCILET